eukprot:Amastigsp_a174979_86.p3 type:complete len:100 gc:universal Amastigsp_a174979_86:733-434(-)
MRERGWHGSYLLSSPLATPRGAERPLRIRLLAKRASPSCCCLIQWAEWCWTRGAAARTRSTPRRRGSAHPVVPSAGVLEWNLCERLALASRGRRCQCFR